MKCMSNDKDKNYERIMGLLVGLGFLISPYIKGRGGLKVDVYDAIEALAKTTKRDGVEAFLEAINNVKPFIEVKSRRVGGATYQVPIEVRGPRAQQLSIKWIIGAARKRGEKTMMDRLAGELNDALNNRGSAMKKREETHKMAEANKAFAHYRW